MGRMGTLDDTANAAEYLAGALAGYVSGQLTREQRLLHAWLYRDRVCHSRQ